MTQPNIRNDRSPMRTDDTMSIPFSWLNQFPLPLFVVDSALHVVERNTSADELWESGSASASALRSGFGDFIHCINVHEQRASCGDGKRCEVCDFRLAVLSSIKTKQTVKKLEMFFDCADDAGARFRQSATCAMFYLPVKSEAYVLVALGEDLKIAQLQNAMLILELDGLIGNLAESLFDDGATPLTYALSNLEIVYRELMASQMEKRPVHNERVLAPLSDALEGMNGLKTTMDLYRLMRRKRRKAVESVLLSDLVSIATKMIPRELRDIASIQVSETRDVWVRAVPRETAHAILELIENAYESFTSRDPSSNIVEVNVTETVRWVELTIRDNGSGINGQDILKLFEPGYSTKRLSSGFGVGLTYCKNVVATIGGEMKLRARETGGTDASIFFTKAKPFGSEVPMRHLLYRSVINEPTGNATRPCALVVDDDRRLRDAVSRMLRGMDVVAIPMNRASLTIELGQRTFDVIILDVNKLSEAKPIYDEMLVEIDEAVTSVVCMTGPMASLPLEWMSSDVKVVELSKPFTTHQLQSAVYQAHCDDATGELQK